MTIHYFCRHCGTNVGNIHLLSADAEQLGIDRLTNEERQEMISYEPDGNIHIKAICEDCQEALDRNPKLHEHDYLIQ